MPLLGMLPRPRASTLPQTCCHSACLVVFGSPRPVHHHLVSRLGPRALALSARSRCSPCDATHAVHSQSMRHPTLASVPRRPQHQKQAAAARSCTHHVQSHGKGSREGILTECPGSVGRWTSARSRLLPRLAGLSCQLLPPPLRVPPAPAACLAAHRCCIDLPDLPGIRAAGYICLRDAQQPAWLMLQALGSSAWPTACWMCSQWRAERGCGCDLEGRWEVPSTAARQASLEWHGGLHHSLTHKI